MTFQKKIISRREFEDCNETVFQLYKSDNSLITTKDVQDAIEELSNRDYELIVRGLNIQKWTTLKTLDGEFDANDYDDYYINKVKDPNKFLNFEQLQICAFKNK